MEKAQIYVANDDKAYLGLMKDLLEEEGYSVTLLHAGNEVYEKVKKEHPNLIILDIMMSEPDTGWKLLDKLTLDPETTRIPVLICSGDVRSIRDKADNLRKMGCLTIEKPFDLDTMLSMVREALALRK